MNRKRYLPAGQIVGTHGVRGEVRVNPWCDGPDVLTPLHTLYADDQGARALTVRCRPHKTLALVTIEGVDTVQAASALRGQMLYLDRQDLTLEEGQYFIEDLLGLAVVDADTGATYGTLTQVSATGANDVYHVATKQGERLIPAVAPIVAAVDLEGGQVRVRPLKGMMDDAD